MPEITFLNSENLNQLWSFVGTLLKGVSPGILISFSIVCVGLLINIVIKAWKGSAKEQEDEDVDIRHY